MSTTPDMPSLHPRPETEYFFKACRKGDPEAKAVTVNQSPVAALAKASEITGLPRDNFEVYEISNAEFKASRSKSEHSVGPTLSGEKREKRC
jgi:hypothetical protein